MNLTLPGKRWLLLFFLCFLITLAIFIPQSKASAEPFISKSAVELFPSNTYWKSSAAVNLLSDGQLDIYVDHNYSSYDDDVYWKVQDSNGYLVDDGWLSPSEQPVNKRIHAPEGKYRLYLGCGGEFFPGCSASGNINVWK
jgi:hypothetical protein